MSSVVMPLAVVSPHLVVAGVFLFILVLLMLALVSGEQAYWERAERRLLENPQERAYVGFAHSGHSRDGDAAARWTTRLASQSADLLPWLHNRRHGRGLCATVMTAERDEQVLRWSMGRLVDNTEGAVKAAKDDLENTHGKALSLSGTNFNPVQRELDELRAQR